MILLFERCKAVKTAHNINQIFNQGTVDARTA